MSETTGQQERSRDFERLLTFVDAIVAIAITLLVLPLVDVVAGLKDHFEINHPGGAFYVFPKVPGNGRVTATEFAQRAIDKNVLFIPGNVFSSRDTHFRISYATTDQKLDQGLAILRELAEEVGR